MLLSLPPDVVVGWNLSYGVRVCVFVIIAAISPRLGGFVMRQSTCAGVSNVINKQFNCLQEIVNNQYTCTFTGH